MKIKIFYRRYSFLENVDLPLIVEGTPYFDGFLVTTGELRKSGVPVDPEFHDNYEWCFSGLSASRVKEARKASWFARFNNWLRKL